MSKLRESARGWYAERFMPNQSKVEKTCPACETHFWVPQSEVLRRLTCGLTCRRLINAKAKEARMRDCCHCGKRFLPRTTQVSLGQGKYCSISCATNGNGQLWTKEVKTRAVATFKEGVASGRVVVPRGKDHRDWKGGPEASMKRRQESGKNLASLRRYRANNPTFMAETQKRRRGRKIGRLPRGTIKRIGDLQRWRCAACVVVIKTGYHVDHIMPLALGGEHSPSNIQLLCGPCNLRKSAKHPVRFMQERGFLL